MASTMDIYQWTGASAGSGTLITGHTARMSQADVVLLDSSSTASSIPATNSTYSCWVSTRLHCTVAPGTSVGTIVWFSDGAALGTGITVYGAKANLSANAGYLVATTAPPTLLSQGNHAGLAEAPADVTTYTSGATHALAGAFTSGDVGTNKGDFFVYQLRSSTSASPGATGVGNYSWQFAEI
jgi:hypothetical protein